MKKLLLVGAFLALFALNASAVHVVDLFTDGNFSKSATAGTITDSQSGLKDVIGVGGVPPGRRDVLTTITKSNPPNNVQTTVGAGKLALSTPPLANATLQLNYGSYTNAGPKTGTDLNASFLGDYGLTFELNFADLNGQVVIDLDAGGATYKSAALSIPPVPGGSVLFQVPFASFPGLPGAALADVDGLRYTFSSPDDAWDITLDSLSSTEIIPEPATLSLLGLGLLALARRRRKS